MIIGYDAKRYFHNRSGLGNYSRDLLRILAEHYPSNQYLLFDKRPESTVAPLQSIPLRPKLFSRQWHLGLQAQDCTIFHGLSGELPLRWARKSPHKVVTIHDLIFEKLPKYYSFLDRKIYFAKFLNAAKQADLVVAISEQTKKDILQLFKIPEKKIQVIYQGCNPLFKEELPEEFLNKTRTKYQLPDKYILNVGTLEDRKNGMKIIEALEEEDIPMVFAGRNTSYTEKMKAYVQKKGLSSRVWFLEGLSNREIAALYRFAQVFAYPSEYEGFGIPIIEALNAGVPVVTNELGVFPEAGGPSSLYVKLTDKYALREALVHLWENEADRQKRITEGKIYVQRFDDAPLAKQWMQAYQGLI
jgi:glycosyltransferase involved in cell wall biosynthesis